MRGCLGAGIRNASVPGCSSNGFFKTSINRLTCTCMGHQMLTNTHNKKLFNLPG